MKLTSFWKTGAVFWHVFKIDDFSHIGDFNRGFLEHYGDSVEIQMNFFEFQLGIKMKGGVFGDSGMPIHEPDPIELFNNNADLVLNNDRSVRPFIYPTLSIESPAPNAQLDQPHLDRAVEITLLLNLGDQGRLIKGKESYLSDKEMFVVLKPEQPGFPQVVLKQSDFSEILDISDNPIKIQYKANLLIKHSGSATIRALLRSSSDSISSSGKIFLDTSIKVNITPTTLRNYDVVIDGQTVRPDRPAIINAPVGGGYFEVVIQATASDDYKNVKIQSSHDRFQSQTPNKETQGGKHKWTASLYIAPNHPPSNETLKIIDVDFFDKETISPAFGFTIKDVTKPIITLNSPSNHHIYDLQQVSSGDTIVVRGIVSDTQSGYKKNSLTYSFGEEIDDAPVSVAADGSWELTFPLPVVGSYGITMSASDNADNMLETFAVFQFDVVAAYKPKSIDELLSPSAYLNELLRFARSHLLIDTGGSVNTNILTENFKQPFGVIAQPNATDAEQLTSDLLIPVRILRDAEPIARWTFSELAKGALDGLKDKAGRFDLNGSYHGVGDYADVIQRMRGMPETDFEGAMVLDEEFYAEIPNRPALEVGKNNRDFSVSFWIYPQDTGSGEWRQVLYKGTENVNRTFAIFLYPNSNAVHFRIGTTTNWNDGGESSTQLPVGRWSHLAYIKSVKMLKLYINGSLDAEVVLSGDVQANTDSLFIGKSPFRNSFKGGLAELRIYDYALNLEDIGRLALDRRANLTETPIADYHEVVYEALLVGIGTSLEELRGLNALSVVQRRALAERLGLLNSGLNRDSLSALITNFQPGTYEFESWLDKTFGLPGTYSMQVQRVTLPITWKISGSIFVLARHKNLSYQWDLEDTQQTSLPELDPDMFEVTDISPKSSEWLDLLRSRDVELSVQFETFAALLRTGEAAKALSQVYSADELQKLQVLSEQEKAGEPITQALSPFNLDRKMFRRLLAYIERLGITLTAHERDDFSHLLTQLWKVRTRYSVWKQQETTLGSRLWPTLTTDAAWVSGSYKRDFKPWRGNVQQRANMETRFANRLRAWQSIQNEQDQAVAEAQRIALPLLRDGLLGIKDISSAGQIQRMDDLTERWLVDFAASSATFITPVEQATLSLQTLINGIRNQWYEANHVAQGWTIKTAFKGTDFDNEWQWLSTYGSWRAAVLSYLYPENLLFPELLKINNPYGLTEAFVTIFLGELRKLQPLTLDSLRNPPTTFVNALEALTDSAKSYFVPVAIALALQRAGFYTAALDYYHKVYDTSKSVGNRKLVKHLKDEFDNHPPAPFFDDRWTLRLDNPHAVAVMPNRENNRVWSNPYTRYTLMQIVHCLLAQADGEFAAGTQDSRAKALSLYLEAKEILAFDELRDLQPVSPEQAYLPNPVLAAQRAHVEVALRKLRRGLSFLGTPLPPDLTRGPNAGAVSSLVRPTPYRFKVLMERAKQLANQAQQFETLYLSAIERGEEAAEKLMRENFIAEIAGQTVILRQSGEREAQTGKAMAELQRTRSQIQADRYQEWLSAGSNEYERTQIKAIQESSISRQVINVADSLIAGAQASLSIANVVSAIGSVGSSFAFGAAMVAGVTTKAITQGFLIDQETRSQVSGILASQERRTQEWQLQQDLSRQDILIGNQQVNAADDRIAIAAQESLIARTQRDQAQQIVAFLTHKFTNVQFYQWLVGELAEVYAFFLRIATSTAQQAELQIAFERQEAPARLIKSDYWLAASQSSTGGTSPDRRGITGSARLIQDLYTVDQQAFSSERRLLNLAQSFSLSRLIPLEFEEFRRTGLLTFSTPMQWFDEGFPGHYMRLIKRVRISVAALIPPSQGIHATLTNGGLSRVVTSDPGYPTMVIRQNPQSVSLTSPISATGVFDLDTQSDLLYPFEGTGVDTTWFFELPPAGNFFDFDTLAEVMLSVEYTALMSYDLRDRVVKKLPRQFTGDRGFSIKRDFPDFWYDIANSMGNSISFTIPMSKWSFPPGLTQLRVSDVSVSAQSTDRKPCAFGAKLTVTLTDGSKLEGNVALSIKGMVSSRQTGGASWHTRQIDSRMVPVIDDPRLTDADVQWTFEISNQASTETSTFLEQLRNGEVDDILVIMTITGTKPPWG